MRGTFRISETTLVEETTVSVAGVINAPKGNNLLLSVSHLGQFLDQIFTMQ